MNLNQLRKALIKPDLNSAEAWNNRGMALQKMDKLKAAMESYAKALMIKTDYSGAWYNLGNVLGSMGRLGEALDSFEKALKGRMNLPDRGEQVYPVWTRLIFSLQRWQSTGRRLMRRRDLLQDSR